MKYTFTSGTDIQKQLWGAAYGLLRNLPPDQLPLEISIDFVDPSEVGQTNFADTQATYGSVTSITSVRNDAPGFGNLDAGLIAEARRIGLKYDAHQHFNETAIHELGHSVFAALPEEFRIEIAELFGAKSDSSSELNPSGKPWQDRIIEAIAETFKEAFLPARYRVFPNRTNIKLSYSRYPTFRRLVRTGIEAIAGVTRTYNVELYGTRPTGTGGLLDFAESVTDGGGDRGLIEYEREFWESPGTFRPEYIAESYAKFLLPGTPEQEGWPRGASLQSDNNGMWAPPSSFFDLTGVEWRAVSRSYVFWGGYIWESSVSFRLRAAMIEGELQVRGVSPITNLPMPNGAAVWREWAKLDLTGKRLESAELSLAFFQPGSKCIIYDQEFSNPRNLVSGVIFRLGLPEIELPDRSDQCQIVTRGFVIYKQGNFEAAGLNIENLAQSPPTGPGAGQFAWFLSVPVPSGEPLVVPVGETVASGARVGRGRVGANVLGQLA